MPYMGNRGKHLSFLKFKFIINQGQIKVMKISIFLSPEGAGKSEIQKALNSVGENGFFLFILGRGEAIL